MDGPAAWRVLDETTAGGEAGGAQPGRTAVPPTRRLLSVAALAIALLLAVAGIAIAVGGSQPQIEVDGGIPLASDGIAGTSPGSPPHPSAGLLVVDVQGAVAQPGVVRLVAGSRVGDAIAAAGGYGPRVDADRVGRVLNLAALVKDGEQLIVPGRDDPDQTPHAGAGSSGGAMAGGNDAPLDLNTATAAELDGLPGIGPVTAAKIIAARDEQAFASVDELRTRKILGAATFEKLKPLVAVR
jgi:competence protein ComEA